MSPVTVVKCGNAQKVYEALVKKQPVTIKLTAKKYTLDKPFTVTENTLITSEGRSVQFITSNIPAVFMVNGKGELHINNLIVDGNTVKAKSFICSDTSGPSNHYNVEMNRSVLQRFDRKNGCESIFFAHKSTVADSIIFTNNKFSNNNTDIMMMSEEKDDKGYYNAEKITITGNDISRVRGKLLSIYRGGNDESTMGPKLLFAQNNVIDCRADGSLISLTGVQQTRIQSNNFSNSNPGDILVLYKDIVRAHHFLRDNKITGSGKVETNQFVSEQ